METWLSVLVQLKDTTPTAPFPHTWTYCFPGVGFIYCSGWVLHINKGRKCWRCNGITLTVCFTPEQRNSKKKQNIRHTLLMAICHLEFAVDLWFYHERSDAVGLYKNGDLCVFNNDIWTLICLTTPWKQKRKTWGFCKELFVWFQVDYTKTFQYFSNPSFCHWMAAKDFLLK